MPAVSTHSPRQLVTDFEDIHHLVVDRGIKRVVTLFSGGLDSTHLLHRLSTMPGAEEREVTALFVDVGQAYDRAALEKLACRFNARLQIVDMRERFVREACLPAIRCQGRYRRTYPISASLSRPVIARAAVAAAGQCKAMLILHTATPSQNSLTRLNTAIPDLGFRGYFGSPYERGDVSRAEKLEQLREAGLHGLDLSTTSSDANLWCREVESGMVEDPESFRIPHDFYVWTAAGQARPDTDRVAITFERGVPVELNGAPMSLIDLIGALNELAGAYEIGQFEGLEHLPSGARVLEVREAPAAHVLMQAYRHLESAVVEVDLLDMKDGWEARWTKEAVEGRWYGQAREITQQFIEAIAATLYGTVEFRMRPGGGLNLLRIEADDHLYVRDRESFEHLMRRGHPLRPLAERLRVESAE